MPTIVLRDADNNDIGFLMAAGDAPLSEHCQREVIFMALPIPNTSDLANFVRQHKHTEWNAAVRLNANGFTYAFNATPSNEVLLSIGEDGAGTWSVQGIGQGTCMALST